MIGLFTKSGAKATTHVLEGQEATVLQLPVQPATAAEAKAQERVAHVG